MAKGKGRKINPRKERSNEKDQKKHAASASCDSNSKVEDLRRQNMFLKGRLVECEEKHQMMTYKLSAVFETNMELKVVCQQLLSAQNKAVKDTQERTSDDTNVRCTCARNQSMDVARSLEKNTSDLQTGDGNSGDVAGVQSERQILTMHLRNALLIANMALSRETRQAQVLRADLQKSTANQEAIQLANERLQSELKVLDKASASETTVHETQEEAIEQSEEKEKPQQPQQVEEPQQMEEPLQEEEPQQPLQEEEPETDVASVQENQVVGQVSSGTCPSEEMDRSQRSDHRGWSRLSRLFKCRR